MAGGMGAVLEAHHLVLDQRVAIDLVLPEAAKRDPFFDGDARFVGAFGEACPDYEGWTAFLYD